MMMMESAAASARLETVLTRSLNHAMRWYKAWVNPQNKRFQYEWDPRRGMMGFTQVGFPAIRELGTVWDVALISRFLKRNEPELNDVIDNTMQRFFGFLLERTRADVGVMGRQADQHAAAAAASASASASASKPLYLLDGRKLGEPANIADNAMMILAMIHENEYRRKILGSAYPYGQYEWQRNHDKYIRGLANAIVEQQRRDGSYKIYFDPQREDAGIEFYPAESMLALLKVFEATRDPAYLDSVKHAFPFYRQYFLRGNVTGHYLVFFSNWQTQACRLLFEHTSGGGGGGGGGGVSAADAQLARAARDYVLHLNDQIVFDAKFFHQKVRNRAEHCATVEVACGLEGLADAYALVDAEDQRRRRAYQDSLAFALSFLLRIQHESTTMVGGHGAGGFSHALGDPAQRVDVTGHVVNAFIKLFPLLRDEELCDACLQILRKDGFDIPAPEAI